MGLSLKIAKNRSVKIIYSISIPSSFIFFNFFEHILFIFKVYSQFFLKFFHGQNHTLVFRQMI
jgi:hypothetical protein